MKFRLLLTVSDEILERKENAVYSLSLALGNIKGYLEDEEDISTIISDLNEKNVGKYSKEQLQILYDIDKVCLYLQGYECEDVERIAENLLSEYEMKDFDVYGVSIGGDFSLFQIHSGLVIAKYIQNKFKCPVIVGGNNITYIYNFGDIYDELWKAISASGIIVLKGAGERTLAEIIPKLVDGEKIKGEDIPGGIYFKDSKLCANSEANPIVVRPKWDGLNMDIYKKHLKKNQFDWGHQDLLTQVFYLPDTFKGSAGQLLNEFYKIGKNTDNCKIVLPYIFNYNCPYMCAFCNQSDEDKKGVIIGAVEKVVDDIEYLMKKHNTNYFYFLNNSFNYSIPFVQEFGKKIRERNIEIYWSDCGRVNNLTYELLESMYQSGCRKLTFGFESGSEKILELINKNIDLNKLERVLKWCYEIGIKSDLEVIIGLPYESEAEFAETYKFIYRNRKYINYFWVNEFFVVPNSLIGKYPDRYDISIRKDYRNYRDLALYNKRKFLENNAASCMGYNSRLYAYDENNGRSYEQISIENADKIRRLNLIQNSQIYNLAKIYEAMLKKYRK